MVSEKQESLLSVDDAADSIGVTKQTVTRLIREEKLPAQKVGNNGSFAKKRCGTTCGTTISSQSLRIMGA